MLEIRLQLGNKPRTSRLVSEITFMFYVNVLSLMEGIVLWMTGMRG